jgi:integrase
MPQFVAEALAEHIRQFPPGSDGTLFTTRHGNPYRTEFYGSVIFKKAVKATARIPDTTTTHDLRHHYVSVLLDQLESPIAVAKRLGHKNAALVHSTYGHLMPETEDRARRTRQALEKAWASDSAADQARTKDHP